MFSFLIGVAIFALDVWAILNVFRSKSSDGAKVLWTAAILLIPPFGLIAWALAGPKDTKLLPGR